jgi:hypothetical protein
MLKLKRLLLCHTGKKTRSKNRSAESDAPKTAAVPADGRADGRPEGKGAATVPVPAAAAVPTARVVPRGVGAQGDALSSVAEKAVAVGCSVKAAQIPTGPAAWKHKNLNVIGASDARDGGSQGQLPYKRRRRGRRGRRRKNNPNANNHAVAKPATTNGILIQPLQFITSPRSQDSSSSEDGDTIDGNASLDTAASAPDVNPAHKSDDEPKSPRVKAFNLTFLKHELLDMKEALSSIKSLKAVEADEKSEDNLAKEASRFEERLQSLLESVSKAESAQWSNLESNKAAKGRRPR